MATITSTPPAVQPMRRTRGVLGWVWQIVMWLVILLVVTVVAIAVLIPRLGDATPYTILTGSMRPGMPPGTLVVVKPVRTADIGIGMGVTYQLESGRPTVVTHRVVAVGEDRHGKPIFQTQGDANPTPDPKWVLPVQIKGERWYHEPYLGRVNTWITGSARDVTFVVVVSVLVGYALVMFAGSAWDRRRKQARS